MQHESFAPIEQLQSVQNYVSVLKQAVKHAKRIAAADVAQTDKSGTPSGLDPKKVAEVEGIIDLLDRNLVIERDLFHELSLHTPVLRNITTQLEQYLGSREAQCLETPTPKSLVATNRGLTPTKASTDVNTETDNAVSTPESSRLRPSIGTSDKAMVASALPPPETAFHGHGGFIRILRDSKKSATERISALMSLSFTPGEKLRIVGVGITLLIAATITFVVTATFIRQSQLSKQLRVVGTQEVSEFTHREPQSKPHNSPDSSHQLDARPISTNLSAEQKVKQVPPPPKRSELGRPVTKVDSVKTTNAPIRRAPKASKDPVAVRSDAPEAKIHRLPIALNAPVTRASELIDRVEPIYPESARLSGIEGDVSLRVSIDESGTVRDVIAIDGPVSLIPAAADAVRRWKYRPQSVNGRPISSDSTVLLKFRLNSSKPMPDRGLVKYPSTSQRH